MTAAEKLSPEVRALILATLAKRVAEEKDLVKAEFSAGLLAGTTLRFRSPLGDKLGSVGRSDPSPEWRITDPQLLDEHLRSFPGCVSTTVGIAPGDMAEVLAVLSEHAPHLITETVQVDPSAAQAALEESRTTGQAVAPGIGQVRPGGVVTVRPDKDAAVAVQRMAAAGLLSWASVLALDPAVSKASAS